MMFGSNAVGIEAVNAIILNLLLKKMGHDKTNDDKADFAIQNCCHLNTAKVKNHDRTRKTTTRQKPLARW
jgi:uncharacterized protein YwlG (UPF0340 family)